MDGKQGVVNQVLNTQVQKVSQKSLLDSINRVIELSNQKENICKVEFVIEVLKISFFSSVSDKLSYAEWSAKFDAYIQNELGSAEDILSAMFHQKKTGTDQN